MNKLFTKIAALSVGLAMAIGVGVAVGSDKAVRVNAAISNPSETMTFSSVYSSVTGSSSQSVEDIDISGTDFKVHFTKRSGGTETKYYANGTAVRWYGGGTLVVSSSTKTIEAIDLVFTQHDNSVSATGYTDITSSSGTGSWTGSATSVTFTQSGTKGQDRISAISVKYSGGGTVTNYDVTLHANNGTETTTSDTTDGSSYTVPNCSFAYTGYTFTKWALGSTSGTQYAAGASITGISAAIHLYALWEEVVVLPHVTLDSIGSDLGSTANDTMLTTDIADGDDTYTLNYLQCKKQGSAMLMTKDVGSFISNHTRMPGPITSIELYINSGASGKTTYDVIFGATEFTTAASATEGAVNITGGNSHEFENESVSGARYFCVVLGNSNNGQVLKIVINYEEVVEHTVTFNANGHGTAPSAQKVEHGQKASKPSDPEATGYTFGGWFEEQACENEWNFESDTVSEDITLWASWTQNKYTVTWKNYDGTTLETDNNVLHGATPSYDGETPTRAADAQYTYTFSGWNPTVGAITGNTTYTAQFSTTTNNYTITWKNYDGTTLETDENVPYGTTPSYDGSTPTKAGTTQYSYVFNGWSPTVASVTGDAIYTAQFEQTLNTFTVTGNIDNGTLENYTAIEYGGDLINQILPESNAYGYPEEITVMMGNVNITDDVIYNSTDGSILYENVTGNITITATCPLLATYSIDYTGITNGSASGDTTVRQLIGSSATVTISTNGHSHLPQSVTVKSNNVVLTEDVDYSYDSSDGTLVLTVTANYGGDIVITATCNPFDQYDVVLSLSGVSKTSGPSGVNAIEEGEEDVTWVFAALTDHVLPETITVVCGSDTLVDGDDYTWTKSSGTLVIPVVIDDLTITVTGGDKELDRIELSSISGSYDLGDTLEAITVTAYFNTGEELNVSTLATITGTCIDSDTKMLITTGTNQEITFSYTYNDVEKTATYRATVTKITPSAGGVEKITDVDDLVEDLTVYLVCEGKSIQLNGISSTSTKYGLGVEFDTTPSTTVFPLTVCEGSESGTFAFENNGNYLYWDSGNSLNVDSSISDNSSWEVEIDSDGNATITNYKDSAREIMWNISSTRFACYTDKEPSYDGATGYNKVQLYKTTPAVEKELIRITAGPKEGITYYQGDTVTAETIKVTAYYNDDTSEIVTNNVTISGATLANIGANTINVSYGGKSCTGTITAAERTAVLTGLSWAQGAYQIFDDQNIDFSKFGTVTATYDTAPSATKSIASCIVGLYFKVESTYTLQETITDGYTISLEDHEGLYLGVSYTEGGVTQKAYSSAPLDIVEKLESIRAKSEQYVFDGSEVATSIEVGDIVVFAGSHDDDLYELAIQNTSKSVFDATQYTTNPVGTMYFEVVDGSTTGTVAFKNGSNYLCASEAKKLTFSSTLNSDSSWNVSFDEIGRASISHSTTAARKIQFNYNNGNPRFSAYESSQTLPFLIKGEKTFVPYGDNIANTDIVVQKAVLAYATHFNDVMNCIQGGTTANVSGKWSDLSDDFDDALSAFENDQLDLFKEMYKYADAIEHGDTLQDMLARYEYICAKYKLDDFISSKTDRLAVSQRYNGGVLTSLFNSSNSSTATIIIVSVISVAAVGGYFFLQKRKED